MEDTNVDTNSFISGKNHCTTLLLILDYYTYFSK